MSPPSVFAAPPAYPGASPGTAFTRPKYKVGNTATAVAHNGAVGFSYTAGLWTAVASGAFAALSATARRRRARSRLAAALRRLGGERPCHGDGSCFATARHGCSASNWPTATATAGVQHAVSAGLGVEVERQRPNFLSAFGRRLSTAVEILGQERRILPQLLWNAALIMIYVAGDIAVYVAGDYASKGHEVQTVLLGSSLTSVVVSAAMAASTKGMKGLRECSDLGGITRFLPVSASFGLASLCLLQAFRHFDASFVKILGQLKLPFAAVISTILLGRRYSSLQWQLILLITIACMSFAVLRVGVLDISGVHDLGFFFVMGWVVLNCVGTILAEKLFKDGWKLDLPVLMVHMRVGEALTALVALVLRHGLDFSSALNGWDFSTVLLMFAMLGDSWLSALMVKHLSSVATKVSKTVSLVVLYGHGVMTARTPFVLLEALGALMIAESTALFVTASVTKSAGSKA